MRWITSFALLLPCCVLAADADYVLTLKDHRFEPAQMEVPSGKKIRLIIDNRDSTAEEFESHALNREKVVPANTRVPVFVGPLAPGRYPFFGEFHEKTAQGELIVR